MAPARIHPEFLDETCVLVEPGGTSWGEEKEWSSFFHGRDSSRETFT